MGSTKVVSSPSGIARDGGPVADSSTIRPIGVNDNRPYAQAPAYPDPTGIDSGSAASNPTKPGMLTKGGGDGTSIIPGPVNAGLPNIGKSNNWGPDTTVTLVDSATFPDTTIQPYSDSGNFTDNSPTPNQGVSDSLRLPITSFNKKTTQGNSTTP